ncbi:MAG: tetratricopeptide repeat protein [Bacteroidales bacterium]|nr:tetratricopeptide repeat protein [Bacteroidales bacterium]
MKFRVLAIFAGVLLAATLSAQTLTDVINEFNTGVEKLNGQEYEVALEHFNQVLTMAEVVGDEANDMKAQAQKQIPSAYYRQATTFMKRKQYDNAIPFLELTVETATLYNNNAEISKKAAGYLPQLYVREGNANRKNKSYDDAIAYFDKAIALNPNLYQACQGKGMVYLEQDETDLMLECFANAKEGAMTKNDTKAIGQINGVIDSYYNKFIMEEVGAIDPEENDFTYVLEACENALAANPNNPRALYHLAMVSNKTDQSEKAIEYTQKALLYEKEAIWLSAINFELGSAYQSTKQYDEACEALQKVTEDPFLTRAEKKIEIVGCN